MKSVTSFEENECEDCEKTFSDKECNFTGIQDLLAEDSVEVFQAIVCGILSGNPWDLE